MPHDEHFLSLFFEIELLPVYVSLVDEEAAAADVVGLSVTPASLFFFLHNSLSMLDKRLSKYISIDSATISNGAKESVRVVVT